MFGKKPSGGSSSGGFKFKGVQDGFSAREAFAKKLDAEKIKYDLHQEKPIVYISYKGDNFDGLTFTFIFDDDGKSFALRVFSIEKFTPDQLPDAYEFCNSMCYAYRWLRFYVDSDNEFTAALDAVIDENNTGDVCYELLSRSVSIVDDVCGKMHE